MTLYDNYNSDNGVTGNNNNNSNNNGGRNSAEFSKAVVTNSSMRPSCSSISVMVEGGLRWKTNVVTGGTISSAATLPRRDFHFKRIEIEETPKWFVWPKRNKESKSSRNEMMIRSSSGNNNLISPPDTLPSKNPPVAVSAIPQNIINLTNTNNNWQQNLVEQDNLNRITLVQSRSDDTMMQSGARQHRQHEMHYHTVTSAGTSAELINISSSEPNSYIMHCHIATRADSEHHISGSVPTASQTFKILSISKKTLESYDDDDLDLANSVISSCRQSRSQPIVLLSRPTAGDAIKKVH
ncbi:hypothetical protein LOAG_16744 [Loa loa]|uniref:Uncharacterized protein n=1 Tax=Loa loa TaxID=7209 RepID=A0A1S0UL17_LOALO|nr:hypothetical protein LOAG_16744 [Loa loa]EJD76279.1 hypothetical protein LOAG_16744 [Loa loa]